MDRHIILASHGNLAEGLYNALRIILGQEKLSNVAYLNCYMEDTQNVTKEIETMLNRYDDEILVFTDLFGGSVNTAVYSCMEGKSFELIAGMNLPLLIETVLFQGTMQELIAHLKANSSQYIVFLNNTAPLAEDENF